MEEETMEVFEDVEIIDEPEYEEIEPTYSHEETEDSDSSILPLIIGGAGIAAATFVATKFGKPIINRAKRFGRSFKQAWNESKTPDPAPGEPIEVEAEVIEEPTKSYTYKK